MIIAQLLLPCASEYERKSQAIDFAALSAEHQIALGETEAADIVHVYGPSELDPRSVRDLRLPYVSNSRPKPRLFDKVVEPCRIITPIRDTNGTFIPEAVDEHYYGITATREPGSRAVIGTCVRKELRNIIEQTAGRIQRYRNDVDWLLFDSAPSPDDLRGVDVWVDPAISNADFDGFVAESIAAGVAVVASRTPINTQRLEKGRTGVLVPPGDPNEWTHAILATLFKQEFRHIKVAAAQQTASKFRPRHRARALIQLYESILQ
jgi:hypothetical protein